MTTSSPSSSSSRRYISTLEAKIVRVPYGYEVLMIQGDGYHGGNKSRLSIISYTKTQKGCQVFLAQVMEKKAKDKSEEKRLEDVPTVHDFSEVFPEDLPGLPPARQPLEPVWELGSPADLAMIHMQADTTLSDPYVESVVNPLRNNNWDKKATMAGKRIKEWSEYAGVNVGASHGFTASLARALKLNDFYHDTVHQICAIGDVLACKDPHWLVTKMKVGYPMEEYLIRVEETDPVVNLIVGFAVDAFNDSYHKYVKEHRSKNITQVVPLVCEYYKSTSKYCFYVTLDAIEQGKPGVYKAAVECDRGSGARTLCQFALTNHKTK
ncbi:hypothetical protein Tco_0128121, partial [Tanacetum coccineum]